MNSYTPRHSSLEPRGTARSFSKMTSFLLLTIMACLLSFGALRASHISFLDKNKQPNTAHSNDGNIAGTNNSVALHNILTTWAKQYSFKSTVFVEELNGAERSAGLDATTSAVPASTYKLFVAYATLYAVQHGTETLATTTADGNTIQTDLNNMILNSDNDAARTLGFLYGWKNINALLKTQGITSTNLYNYVPPSTQPVGDKHTTATDLATLLRKLHAGTLLNASNTNMLLNLLKTQYYRERIPSGVPNGVTVADKPGWLTVAEGDGENIENDAAIVYGPKSTYLLVITTTGNTTEPLANLSTQVYDYLEN